MTLESSLCKTANFWTFFQIPHTPFPYTITFLNITKIFHIVLLIFYRQLQNGGSVKLNGIVSPEVIQLGSKSEFTDHTFPTISGNLKS